MARDWPGAASLDLPVVVAEEAELDVCEGALELVVEAAGDAELAAASRAVAFLVPHCSLFLHWVWANASLGWSLMHWMYVAWHM